MGKLTWDTQLTSGQVHRESFEIGERAMVESAFVGGAQDHAGSLAGLKRFLPPRGAEAPTVAGFQAAKAELRHRGQKIVAAGFGKREKLGGHDGADRVATDVLSSGVAAAVSKEAGHGVYRAEFKPVTEHVTGGVPPTGAITAVVPQHCRLRVGVAGRLIAVMQRLCVPVKNVSATDIPWCAWCSLLERIAA
jgi:hypothetical protein